MKIVRKLLTPAELQPVGTRYHVDCNCIQRTVDDGATWTDAPGEDPRHAAPWRLPPIIADDPKCQAAANMVELVHGSVDRFVSSAGVAQAATTMLDLWLLAVGPVGWIIDLIVIAAEGFFAIGTVAIELTFTSTVYDELECIFYCNIGDDGQCSAEQLSSILDDIHALGDGVIDGVMDLLLNTWGEVGLSNAGAVGSATADCSGCGCAWCYPLDFTVQDYGLVLSALNGGTWVSGAGWRTTDTSVSGDRTLMQGTISLGFDIDITKAAIVYDWTSSLCGTGCSTSGSVWGYGLTDPYEYNTTAGDPCTTPEGTDLIQHLFDPATIGKLVIDFQTSFTCFGGEATVKRINLFGTDPDSLAALIAAFGAAECI